MRSALALVLIFLLQSQICFARLHKESEYQKAWCDRAGGITEYRNPDNTRVDCLTEEYAIEFDFADKWAESVGQTLYYSISTAKKPAIVLIAENGEKDVKNIQRALVLARKYDILLQVMTPEDIAY